MEQPALAPIKTTRQPSQEYETNRAPVISSPWVIGLCSVLFDVDKGQTLQDLWPADCISHEEMAAVAFHAFPDSLSMELYTRNAVKDSSFTFRIKRDPPSSTNGVPDFLYGYVFCRQRQDESLRRGGEQASVVVLTGQPLGGALLPLSQAAGHAFFSEGPLALAAVHHQVLSWPPPIPGGRMCLPVCGGVINARLPHFCILPPPQPAVDPTLLQSTLARRASRSLSIKAGCSPRTAAAAEAANAAASPAAAAATALCDAHAEQQQQQQQHVDLPAAAVISPQSSEPSAFACSSSSPSITAAAAASGSLAAAAAADDSSWDLVADDLKQQQQPQQQQQQQSSIRSSGSFSNLLGGFTLSGSRTGSSRLSRIDLASAASSGSSSSNGNLTAAAAAASSNGGSSSGSGGLSGAGSSGGGWLVATLGQHWRDETPFPEVEPALVLAPLLRELWTLWQLLVTAQPLMVVGLTPGETSAAVAALASLIAPLPYAADFRPYFTIHDADFIALAAGALPKRQRYQEVLPQQQQEQQQEQLGVAAAVAAGEAPPQQQQQVEQQQHNAPAVQEPQQHSLATTGPGSGTAHDLQKPNSTAAVPQQQQQPATAAAAAAKELALPSLLGVTNLYFVKALPKWPNIVAVSRKEPLTATSSGGGSSSNTGSRSGSPHNARGGIHPMSSNGGGAAAAGGQQQQQQLSSNNSSSNSSSPVSSSRLGGAGGLLASTAAAAVRALQRRHQGPQHLLSHFSPHLWTSPKHTQYIRPDYALLSKARAAIEPAAAAGAAGPAAAAAAAGSSGSGAAAVAAASRLRRHFAELTAGFLSPFEMYFNPGPNGKVPAWRAEVFLQSLSTAPLPPALTARLPGSAATAAAALYGAFIESPNFAFWFQQRRAAVIHLVEEEPEEEVDEGYAEVAAGDAELSSADDIQCCSEDDEPDEVELVQQLLSAEQALTTQGQQAQEQQEQELLQEKAINGAEQQQQQQQQQQQDRLQDEVLSHHCNGDQHNQQSVQEQQDQEQEQQEPGEAGHHKQTELQKQFVCAFHSLPRDLQVALISNPARQQLLKQAVAVLYEVQQEEEQQDKVSTVLVELQQLLLESRAP